MQGLKKSVASICSHLYHSSACVRAAKVEMNGNRRVVRGVVFDMVRFFLWVALIDYGM
jgi:hypothetical protein